MDLTNLLNPLTTALLVIYKQAGYFDPALVMERYRNLPINSANILDSIDDFIDNARRAPVEVVWTQMVEDIDLSPLPISEIMRVDPDKITTITKPGSQSFEIFRRVKPSSSEKIITKYRYDAFAKTELSAYLNGKGIKSVVLIGGYASRCVLASVVGANGQDLFCVVPRGLVVNQETSANEVETLYDIVNAIFGITPKVEEILAIWHQ